MITFNRSANPVIIGNIQILRIIEGENGQSIAARLGEAWKGGGQLDAVIVAGGGAESEHIIDAIVSRFPHAEVLDDPQLAVAQGYARLARRWALAEQPVASVA